MDVLELSVPADPALALTARMFAGAVGEHIDEVAPEDLKLAFSELLAAAIDAGSKRIVFRADLERRQITVAGAGPLGPEPGGACSSNRGALQVCRGGWEEICARL